MESVGVGRGIVGEGAESELWLCLALASPSGFGFWVSPRGAASAHRSSEAGERLSASRHRRCPSRSERRGWGDAPSSRFEEEGLSTEMSRDGEECACRLTGSSGSLTVPQVFYRGQAQPARNAPRLTPASLQAPTPQPHRPVLEALNALWPFGAERPLGRLRSGVRSTSSHAPGPSLL